MTGRVDKLGRTFEKIAKKINMKTQEVTGTEKRQKLCIFGSFAGYIDPSGHFVL